MKNNKAKYYLGNIFKYILPNVIYRKQLDKIINSVNAKDKEYILKRVNYYNKLSQEFSIDETFQNVQEFKKNKKKTYFFDIYEYTRYFDPKLKIKSLFGDIIHVPSKPTLLKSRPINNENTNSILFKLNKVRHFLFLDDKTNFLEKKDSLVWRGAAYKEHRISFVKKFYDNQLCNIGQTNNPVENVPWQKPKMSIEEQLQYKFILSIEGNDVASNLKWVMSSNSLAFMIKPKYETWFMEGTLIPNYHYVLLKDDYSDLEEKIMYYSEHTNKALEIISNANNYVNQFKNKKQEDLISLLVLKKYFDFSKQI